MPKGRLEFERTKEIVGRALPAPPASVADIGGGPGSYSAWLAGLGYHVEHRDVIELHVEQVCAAGLGGVSSVVGDARDVDLPDASVDAVLLLGPLYHLVERTDRIAALREACRIVRPGGAVGVEGLLLAGDDLAARMAARDRASRLKSRPTHEWS